MNANVSSNPVVGLTTFIRHRELLSELIKRDFIGRYKGSVLGVGWSLFNPLLMLAVYTLVFSVAFKARWNTPDDGKLSFAIVLFSGMIIHAFFAECINRAPTLILSNPSYVKKVVFPLEILPIVTLCSALLHFVVSFAVLLGFCIIAGASVYIDTLMLPIILLPLILMALGFSWLLASLGVYLRDLAQAVTMLSTVLIFLAPVFYPITALPVAYQGYIKWNPITLPVNQFREIMLFGTTPNWIDWLVAFVISLLIYCFGYWWFQHTRKGFADVI
ncbi:MAG TPA: ABC transporter permease [Methylophilus sp.]